MPKRGRFSQGPVGLGRMTDRRVMRFVAPEKKFLDRVVTGSTDEWIVNCDGVAATNGKIGAADTNPILSNSGGIVQDATASGRIGSKVAIDSISCRLTLAVHGNAASALYAQPTVRLMLVVDKQPNGSLAAIADILKAPQASPTTPNPDYSTWSRNLSYSTRFTVLYDKVITINRDFGVGYDGMAAIFGYESMVKKVNINKKFKKALLREYATGTTAGASSAVMKNQILLLALPCHPVGYGANAAAATDYQVLISGGIRLRYTDA